MLESDTKRLDLNQMKSGGADKAPERLVRCTEMSAVGGGLQPIEHRNKTHKLNIPIKLRRRGVETKIVVLNAAHVQPRKAPNLIKLIARSTDWFEKLKCGETSSLEEIALIEHMSASDVSRYLPLAFLAPDIVASITKGRQPIELSVQRLKRLSPLPIYWEEQRRLLGYAA